MIAQYSASVIAPSRILLAWLRLLRLGGVAPRIVANTPAFICKESHTSFSPMAWVTCACSCATT
jgi:hypothetical protein